MIPEQKSKRVFLMSWNNEKPAVFKAAQELQNRGYEILYWVVPNKGEIENCKMQFKRTQFHWHNDAIKIIPPVEINEADFAPPGEGLIERLYETESVLITMKQFYKLSGSLLEKKHLFHRLVWYWYGVINKFKPDIIFFSGIPHSVFDYTVYSLAKLLKIKTAMFSYANVSDRYLLISDIKQFSVVLREEYLKNKDKRFKLEDLSPDMQKFYQWHLDNQAGEVHPELKNSLKKLTGINKLFIKFRILTKSFYDLSFFKKITAYLIKAIGPNIKKEYTALQTVPDYSKKYIYLPLHYQPEASTSPLGGVFTDQILLIKTLSYCLPDDWLIYVKEHPIQWATSNLTFCDFRYKGYYQELVKIKNVKLIPLETNSHQLIANSRAICTVSGTAGLESLLRLKPVLLFGNTVYQDGPSVFKVKSVAACRGAIEKIVSGFKTDHQLIINYLISLDRVSYHLNHELETKHSEVTDDEVTKTFVDAMIEETEKKN